MLTYFFKKCVEYHISGVRICKQYMLSHACGRRGGLMVSALDPGVSGPGLRPGRGHCVVFLGKTHSASLHPGV